MPVEIKHQRSASDLLVLWSGWVLGPFSWGLHLMGSYLLVETVCRTGFVWTLHALTFITLLIALSGALLSWRCWTAKGRHWPKSGDEAPNGFVAVSGLLISLLSALVILAEGLPNFILDPCL